MPSPDSAHSGVQVAAKDDIITLAGRLDFDTARQALEAVNEQLSQGPAGARVIDLSGITQSNSAGLALLIEWLAEGQRTKRQISFANIPDSLHQISTVCQVDSLI